MKGELFFIVGNSGSGKDSILKNLLEIWPPTFPSLKIPKRIVTRPSHESEAFISATEDEFKKKHSNEDFCFSWHIYDTYYGIPKETLDWVAEGAFCIINVSRSIVKDAKERFPDLKVIFIRVPYEITRKRIKKRGREAENSIKYQQRLIRAKQNQHFPIADVIIDNSGELSQSTEQLLAYLQTFVKDG